MQSTILTAAIFLRRSAVSTRLLRTSSAPVSRPPNEVIVGSSLTTSINTARSCRFWASLQGTGIGSSLNRGRSQVSA